MLGAGGRAAVSARRRRAGQDATFVRDDPPGLGPPGIAARRRVRRRRAASVLAAFQGEFEQILTGRFGPDRQRVARDFVDHFRDVPAGTFRLGTPEDKQGWTPERREVHRRWLAERANDPEGEAKKYYASSAAAGKGRQGACGNGPKRDLASIIRNQDLQALEDWWMRRNESPADDWTNPQIQAFQLNRYPTLNAWYRLFDPDHGREAFYGSVYARVSGSDEQPAIFVSWYDAWVFCRWACWDGLACRLPHEDEWEYVAKAGHAVGAETLVRRRRPAGGGALHVWPGLRRGPHHAAPRLRSAGRQLPDGRRKPRGNHLNPWDFVDMLGNVWEWTDDLYRERYTRAGLEPESSARVLRGGSWAYHTGHCVPASATLTPRRSSRQLRFSRGQGSSTKSLITLTLGS